MKKYLVIGNPIDHSLSPLIHNYWMKKHGLKDSVYEKRKVEEQDLEDIVNQVRNDEIAGVNVTLPFKKRIIPFLDSLDDTVTHSKTVNTLLNTGSKTVLGLNTDGMGFERSFTMKPSIEYNGKNIFIIGAGGVTSSILFSFILNANKIYITNRTKKKAEQLRDEYIGITPGEKKIEVIDWGENPKICDLIINTTSVGLKNNEKLGLDFNKYENNKNVLFYDLIYNPKETNFLRDARLRGNKTMNGEMMFLNQALVSFERWTGISPQIDNEVIKLLDND
ncbi:shikimate dehydrogenase [Pelagibacterales bacterium SAG-MED20]|nr:shikimate dehydrogenase [Pelagibacterales bacterium SAG-MED20]